MFMIIALIALVSADLCIKAYVEKNVSDEDETPILKDKLILRRKENPGLAFGYLGEDSWAVSVLSGIATVVVGFIWICLLPKRGKALKKTGITMMLAGALSNFSDHVRKDYVVDYLSVASKREEIRRIVFNLGDAFVALGALILAVRDLFSSGK